MKKLPRWNRRDTPSYHFDPVAPQWRAGPAPMPATKEQDAQERLRAADDLRQMLRAAFLSHPAATEEDFERCWPELRDEVLMRHALTIYRKMRLEVKKREAGEGAAVSGDEAGPAGKEKGGPV